MKRIYLLAMLLAFFTFMFTSCRRAGTVSEPEASRVSIHGKIYKIVSYVPVENGYPIWIMYPEDSSDTTVKAPISVTNSIKTGKHSRRNQTVFIIE